MINFKSLFRIINSKPKTKKQIAIICHHRSGITNPKNDPPYFCEDCMKNKYLKRELGRIWLDRAKIV